MTEPLETKDAPVNDHENGEGLQADVEDLELLHDHAWLSISSGVEMLPLLFDGNPGFAA